jgi:hypothetical protein
MYFTTFQCETIISPAVLRIKIEKALQIYGNNYKFYFLSLLAITRKGLVSQQILFFL